MTDDYDHLPVSREELRQALNDAHGGPATEEEVEAAMEEMRTPPAEGANDEPDDDPDDASSHDGTVGASWATCPICADSVIKDDFAEHIHSCDG